MKDLTKVKEYVRKRINGNVMRKDVLIEKVYNKFGFDAKRNVFDVKKFVFGVNSVYLMQNNCI